MARRPTPPKAVDALRHTGDTRRNIPSAEHQPLLSDQAERTIAVTYERRNRDLDPQLMWRGKDEQDWSDLVVAAPPLFIQEKVHPKVLIDDLLRQSRTAAEAASEQLDLFADFNGLPADADRTEFYAHDQHWSNRMILGDSLQVMASLAEREGLRGQVQCIYFDPPYGIKFNSNFQWSTTSRDVKDGNPDHITREPEQVKAFRDTWRDGIHSYLTYLRDRLTVARDLLHPSGSIFVQISDENLHRVRALMDEIFGEANFAAQIYFLKTTGKGSRFLDPSGDYIVWYAKNASASKVHQLFAFRSEQTVEEQYNMASVEGCTYRRLSQYELRNPSSIPTTNRRFMPSSIYSDSGGQTTNFIHQHNGQRFEALRGYFWRTTQGGLDRLNKASRLCVLGKYIRYRMYGDDYPIVRITNYWDDVRAGGFGEAKIYVVQTTTDVIQRCILMATDPGDLVLDPTCGSGTTAYVAEQWGRRWITIDTSRVALALARARVMGARYPYYLLADSRDGQVKEAEVTHTAPSSRETHGRVRQGFVYERVPHITLKAIANNAEIDVIWLDWQPRVAAALEQLNAALRGHARPYRVTTGGRAGQAVRFDAGADETFTMPSGEVVPAGALVEWEVPREAPADWPAAAAAPLAAFWDARIGRQREIDASIAARAEFEYLYDKPYEDRRKVRVAGPFTVESVSPHRTLTVGADDELLDPQARPGSHEGEGFVELILENLRVAGVQQAHKADRITFASLTPWPGRVVCAEGRWLEGSTATGRLQRAAIFIGPEFGTVTRADLVEAAREAADGGFDVLVACAFSYEAHATDLTHLGRVRVLKARMNADLHMAEDLKKTSTGNLFVIFGEPDVEVVSGPWLVASNGRMVAHYGSVAELPGVGSLEALNRLGAADLRGLQRLAADGAVRSDQSGAAGGGVGGLEHRGGSGPDEHGGVPAGAERGERLTGGGGDPTADRGAPGSADAAGGGPAAGGGGDHQQDARRSAALAGLATLSAADFPLRLTTDHYAQVTVHGVDVFHPQTGEVRSDGPEGIACWFIDTDYNEESFFVRHAYFLGANDPYSALKTTLRAEINEEAWASLHSATSRPFDRPAGGRIAVKVINHLGDEVMKVFRV